MNYYRCTDCGRTWRESALDQIPLERPTMASPGAAWRGPLKDICPMCGADVDLIANDDESQERAYRETIKVRKMRRSEA